MKVDRMGEGLNEWGEPVRELPKKQIEESFDQKILRKFQIEESQCDSLAEEKFNAIEFKMNRIHQSLLDGRVSVKLVSNTDGTFYRDNIFEVKLFGPGKFNYRDCFESLQRAGYKPAFSRPNEKGFQIKIAQHDELDEKLIERLISCCYH